MRRVTRGFSVAAVMLMFVAAASVPAFAGEGYSKQQQVVDKAQLTLEKFAANPNIGWTSTQARYAKAILIVPQLLKGAFLFGFEGGTGVLLVRASAFWSQRVLIALDLPAFDRPAKATSKPSSFGACFSLAALVRKAALR